MRDLARLGGLVLALVVLGGCGRDTPEAEEAVVPPLLTIGPEGVEGLDARTPFSRDALASALPPDFELEEGQLVTETDTIPVPVLYVFHEGQIMLEVSPDASGVYVGRVDAASAEVEGPNGLRPGLGFEDAGGRDMTCDPGRGDLSGRAVCTRGGPLRYVFAHGGAPTPDALPSDETLRQSILERIVWTAGGP